MTTRYPPWAGWLLMIVTARPLAMLPGLRLLRFRLPAGGGRLALERFREAFAFAAAVGGIVVLQYLPRQWGLIEAILGHALEWERKLLQRNWQ